MSHLAQLLAEKPAILADQVTYAEKMGIRPCPIRLPRMDSESSRWQPYAERFASNHSWKDECTCEQREKTDTAISIWDSSRAYVGSGVMSRWVCTRHCLIHGSERQSKIAVAFMLPPWLINAAIRASFQCTQGAGGRSIAASLETDFIVGHSSPVMQLIRRRRFRWGNYTWGEERLSSLMYHIRQLFLEGKASRSDVDCEGNNYIGVSYRPRLYLKWS